MFTGIVTGLGQIIEAAPLGGSGAHGKRLRVQAPTGYLFDVQLGDSIAINGACMTVTGIDERLHQFSFDISAESLSKTTGFTAPQDGARVNLEKALRANDRLGGHIVSGHIDGLGRVSQFVSLGESWTLCVQVDSTLAKYLAYKGSITINGVSLTINAVQDSSNGSQVSINLIPHTVQNTALQYLNEGMFVNVEIDTVARYVERMLCCTQQINVTPMVLDASI
jgi:riboflavin synthase